MLCTDAASQHRCITMESINLMFLLLHPKHLDSEGYLSFILKSKWFLLVSSAGFLEHLVCDILSDIIGDTKEVTILRKVRLMGLKQPKIFGGLRFEHSSVSSKACAGSGSLFVRGWLEDSFRPKPVAPTTLRCRQSWKLLDESK